MGFSLPANALQTPPAPLERVPLQAPKIGVVAGGLGAYWPQFDGLLEEIMRSNGQIIERLSDLGAIVTDLGLVSDPLEGARAAKAANAADLDLLVVLVSTYLTSGQMMSLLRDVDTPIVLVNLQPGPAMDHARFGTGEWLAYAGSAGLPEMGVALERIGKPVFAVAGHLDDERAWGRIATYVRVARVLRALRQARHGMMGHLYPGMYDIATNITNVIGQLGGHVEVMEFDDLRILFEQVAEQEIELALSAIRQCFRMIEPVDTENVRFQAQVSAALNRLVAERDLSTLAYFHFGQPGDMYGKLATGFPIGATMLTSRGIPTVTEYELRAAIAMLVTSALGGGGTLTEGQALDFNEGVVELGHNDAADLAITEGSAQLRKLDVFHGKGGGGTSIECGVDLGPVTQFSLAELGNGRLRFIASEGIAVDGPHITIGNTTTRVDFGCDPGEWTETWATSGSTHHWSMAKGHLANDLRALAEIIGAEFRQVAP
ncbi:L-fucose/L-arabinose isomerase family protein [Brevibacterium ammoniilyticum]|uniref:L-fucose/L-arabinose isomerase family protein n=1 Tax=Brevibacterium ammoniilyticum TaxID=1046555 RepID=A0ABP9U1A0_9MICO